MAALLPAGWLAPPALGAQVGSEVEPAALIAIRDYQFQPARVTVKVGAAVRWINREKRTTHSVRFPAGLDGNPAALESERLFPDDSWTWRFERPGRYPYACGPHPEMTGEVHVTD
ncbi:MAG TPA: plastocyanin/azurin family copper-binding protein [Burkholderiaceae bacterium]|nr:plastocyanin/azurin family copper-binding protein [Burkholderiaceae bacterium]HNB45559.1 plastocyanin/azurin family copper-binding protein [Burkholderiaceae bacterium]